MAISTIAYAAIGLSIIYFMTAVIVSHALELVSELLQKRASLLLATIKNLIQLDVRQTAPASPALGEINVVTLADEVYDHGLINGLLPGDKNPAYVPAKNFVMAFMHRFQIAAETAANATADTSNPPPASNLSLTQQIALLPNTCAFKGTLQALDKQAAGVVAQFEDLLTKHYDNVMDRVSGKYKQWSRAVSLVVAFVVVVMFNLDSIDVFRAIDTDVRLQGAVVKAADVLQAATSTRNAAIDKPSDLGKPQAAATANESQVSTQSNQDLMNIAVAAVKPLLDARLPIGWPSGDADKCGWPYTPFIDITNDGPDKTPTYKPKCISAAAPSDYAAKLFGWLITVVAASLGAPFWFRLFETTVRLTGLKPSKSK